MKKYLHYSLLSVLLLNVLSATASADKICIKAKLRNAKVAIRRIVVASDSACPRGSKEILDTNTLLAQLDEGVVQGPQGDVGPQGAPGPQGEPGELRIYGNGSAGPLDITVNTDYATTSSLGQNLQFTDCVIASGVTLRVPSGSILRCTGSFVNNGTILVENGAYGGGYRAIGNGTNSLSSADLGMSPPQSGSISTAVAMTGGRGDSSATRAGGDPAIGAGGFMFHRLNLNSKIYYGMFGGSGGAGNRASAGGSGGGAFYVYSKGSIVNNGLISAEGDPGDLGAGGGGGGIVVLASPLSAENAGTIRVAGGNGGSAGDNIGNTPATSGFGFGAGGGGGGGIVLFASPIISVGTTNVEGGSGGAAASITSLSVTRIAGGGGGAGYGSGGSGGSISAASGSAGSQAFDGSVLEIEADPTALY